MKRFFLALVGVLVFSGISYAQNIGPGTPARNFPENISTPNFGIGYNFNQAEWDGFDIESQRAYAHFGAVFGDIATPYYEVFCRLGAANLEFDDFDGGAEPLYAAGMRVEFKQGRIFGWGGVFQALYMNSFEDSIQIEGESYDVTLEDNWEVDVAFPIHARIPNGLVYLGPVYYHSTSDLTLNGPIPFEGNIDEEHDVGVFGGVALRFRNVSLELEAKYKSDISAGALLTFTF